MKNKKKQFTYLTVTKFTFFNILLCATRMLEQRIPRQVLEAIPAGKETENDYVQLE